MILTCPACSTRYATDPAALGVSGRKVRCAKCQHLWHQLPPMDMPQRVELPPEADPLATPEPVTIPPRPRSRAPQPVNTGFGLLLLVVVLFGVAAAVGYLGRERIIQQWPATRELYALVGLETAVLGEGMELNNINFVRQTIGGEEVLVVQGDIFNKTGEIQGVPNLMATLRNDQNQWLFDWVFRIDSPTLAAGETAHFTTSTKNPPAASKRITISFTDKPVGE
jgi:predicted Zn finger-like uncharacterized protein